MVLKQKVYTEYIFKMFSFFFDQTFSITIPAYCFQQYTHVEKDMFKISVNFDILGDWNIIDVI